MSIRQSSKEGTNTRASAAEIDRECWRRERNCICLKVDVGPGESFLFPYQHFLNALHTQAADHDTLKISFNTHEIVVSGRKLAEIASALEKLEVARIGAVSPRYRELTVGDGAWVTQIDVRLSE